MEKFDLSKKLSDKRLREFSQVLINIQSQLDFKVSSRGWGYQMEGLKWITKRDFDKVEEAINTARKRGYLPVDFVAEEAAREFSGVEKPSSGEPGDNLRWMLNDVMTGYRYYTPDWWEGEEWYIQVVVEKIDLKTLFEPVLHKYHIPIANSKGWSSVLQRAEYARRFKQAEDMGLKCLLLYCGDHDPDGLRISDTLRKNLFDIMNIRWSNGEGGYDPTDLHIDRFGLNFDFIQRNNLTWIDNLITGSGKDLADPKHKNYGLPYLQSYLKSIGKRKCEANAIVVIPDVARAMIEQVVVGYIGEGALGRFKDKEEQVKLRYQEHLEKTGVWKPMQVALRKLNKYESENGL